MSQEAGVDPGLDGRRQLQPAPAQLYFGSLSFAFAELLATP
jgi:hypothetical protein